MRVAPALVLALGLGFVSCGGGGGQPAAPGEPEVESLTATGAVVSQKGRLRIALRTAAAKNVEVTLASGDATVAKVPSTATVPAGARTFELDFDGIGFGTTTVTASIGSSQVFSTVSVVGALQLSSVGSVRAQTGAAVVTYAYLNVASPKPVTFTLSSSNPAVATVPATVSSLPFYSYAPITVKALAKGSAVITVTAEGSSLSLPVVVSDALTINAFYATPARVLLGAPVQLYLSLGVVPAHDVSFTFTSSNPSVAAAPAALTLHAGLSSTYVPVTVGGAGTTTFIATADGLSRTATLTVLTANAFSNLYCQASTLAAAASTDCTVQLMAPSVDDTVVSLASSDGNVLGVPSSVTVPAGLDSAPFVVEGKSAGAALVTATVGAATRSVQLTVGASGSTAVLSNAYLSGAVYPGATPVLYVNLAGAAPADVAVSLSSSNPAVVTLPASATIPANSSYTSLPAPILTNGFSVIRVTVGSSSQSVVVSVTSAKDANVYYSGSTLQTGAVQSMSLYLNATAVADAPFTITAGTPGIVDVTAAGVIRAGTSSMQLPVRAVAAGQTTLRVTLAGEEFGFTAKVVDQVSVSSVSFSGVGVGKPGTLSISFDAVAARDVPITLTQTGAGALSLPANPTMPTGAQSLSLGLLGTTAGAVTVTAAVGASSATGTGTVAP